MAFFGMAFASIGILKPVEAVVSNGNVVEIGKISPGETIGLIVQKKPQKGILWNDIFVDSRPGLENWKIEKVLGNETMLLNITIPGNADESIQRLKILVSSESSSESFTAVFEVKRNLLKADIQNVKQNVLIGKKADFKLVLVNDSIAIENVQIYSSLPVYWFGSQEVLLNPNESKEMVLSVHPKTYGEREFNFYVKSLETGQVFVLPAELDVYPTIKSKYSEALYGLPVFTFSMTPYYLINAFLSVFF